MSDDLRVVSGTDRVEGDLTFQSDDIKENDYLIHGAENITEKDFDYGLDIDGYKITKVLDDVILLEEVKKDESEKDAGGYVIKNGLAFTEDQLGEVEGGGVYKAYKIKMAGMNVKELGVGDIIVVNQKTALKIDFCGSDYLISHEGNVYCVLEKSK